MQPENNIGPSADMRQWCHGVPSPPWPVLRCHKAISGQLGCVTKIILHVSNVSRVHLQIAIVNSRSTHVMFSVKTSNVLLFSSRPSHWVPTTTQQSCCYFPSCPNQPLFIRYDVLMTVWVQRELMRAGGKP